MVVNISFQTFNLLLKNLNFIIDNKTVNCFSCNDWLAFFDFEEVISYMATSCLPAIHSSKSGIPWKKVACSFRNSKNCTCTVIQEKMIVLHYGAEVLYTYYPLYHIDYQKCVDKRVKIFKN